MTKHFVRGAALAAVLASASGPAAMAAQTTPPTSNPAPGSPAAPNAITPPNGVPRGVIRPNRPVDPKMVTRPPAQGDHPMPVITPPGTAR